MGLIEITNTIGFNPSNNPVYRQPKAAKVVINRNWENLTNPSFNSIIFARNSGTEFVINQ